MTDPADAARPAPQPARALSEDRMISITMYAAREHWKHVARNEAGYEYNRNNRLRRILVTVESAQDGSAQFTFICDSGGHIALLDDPD
jgi:hypothetical protein